MRKNGESFTAEAPRRQRKKWIISANSASLMKIASNSVSL
jgi:hypothetical protein